MEDRRRARSGRWLVAARQGRLMPRRLSEGRRSRPMLRSAAARPGPSRGRPARRSHQADSASMGNWATPGWLQPQGPTWRARSRAHLPTHPAAAGRRAQHSPIESPFGATARSLPSNAGPASSRTGQRGARSHVHTSPHADQAPVRGNGAIPAEQRRQAAPHLRPPLHLAPIQQRPAQPAERNDAGSATIGRISRSRRAEVSQLLARMV